MRCPSCGAKMGVREGRFGPFYFCPHQHKSGEGKCHQSTISKHKDLPPERVKELANKFAYRDLAGDLVAFEPTANQCGYCGSHYGFSCTCRL